jgi:group I intron endonuclease
MNNIKSLLGKEGDIKTLSCCNYNTFPLLGLGEISDIKTFLKNNGGIYCWASELNKKVYIGSSKRLWSRFKSYKNSFFYGSDNRISVKLLSHASKHGFLDLKFYVLEIFNGNEKELRLLEQKYLNECQPFNEIGFNIAKFTINYQTPRLREEVILKIKEANTGENSSNAKLNDQKVLEIKTRLANGEKLKLLANEFKVSITVISNIKRGLTWSHVKIDEEGELLLKKSSEKHKRMNMSESLVKEIKLKILAGYRMVDIAKEFGVGYTCVSGLKYGHFYRTINP